MDRGSPAGRRATAIGCLLLGAGVLQGMWLVDVKAILAHEYGHFRNEDTAGGGFALSVRRSMVHSAMALARGGVATWYSVFDDREALERKMTGEVRGRIEARFGVEIPEERG